MMSFIQRLSIFRYMNAAANNVNLKRIKEIGANAAAAEWLLRNGASFKVSHSDTLFKDYNKPPPSKENLKITEIISEESTLMDHGLQHLEGLDALRKLHISSNRFLTNAGLRRLSCVKDTLEELHIVDCPRISDNGIVLLAKLRKLKYLELSHLLDVKDKDLCLTKLETSLKNCKIDWND